MSVFEETHSHEESDAITRLVREKGDRTRGCGGPGWGSFFSPSAGVWDTGRSEVKVGVRRVSVVHLPVLASPGAT